VNHDCLVLLSVFLIGCGYDAPAPDVNHDAPQIETAKVSLVLNWYPEAEHGGYYAALVHGYFAEAGLDVTIIPGGPNTPVLQKVATGAAHFGVSNADQVLLARAQEAPLVTVMAPLQDSPRCLMVHRKSGITRFEQLQHMTIAMSSGAAWAQFLKKRLPLTGVKFIPPGSVAQFLNDDNFAQQAYVFSEPYVAESQGGDPHCLMVSDLGFNPYTSVLFVNQKTISQQSNLVRRMVSASRRGWATYLKSPDETNTYIHEQNSEMSLEILKFGAQAMKPLCNPPKSSVSLGQMTSERWNDLVQHMTAVGALEANATKGSEAYTTQFLSSEDEAQ
jgi:NitT/TauT family transport system substrate-binding protein